MEDNVKILKFVDGKDVICNFFKVSVIEYILIDPMVLSIKYNGPASSIILKHWLPVEVIKKNEVSVNATMVVAIFEPDKDLEEYYLNSVEKFHRMLEQKSKLKDIDDLEELMDVMDALEEAEEQTLH